jgi:predicted nucleic acid-binding protein
MAANSGIILDAGPLVAYLADDEQYHAWATEQMQQHDGPIFTCEAVLSEACYLLRRFPRHLRHLRTMLAEGVFDLSFHLEDEGKAVAHLMDRFVDMPMSLADACLVRLSELHPKAPLFTLDSDFTIYRRHGRQLIPVICPR